MKNVLHLIEKDLDGEAWIFTGLRQVERYLSKWAQFQERHGV